MKYHVVSVHTISAERLARSRETIFSSLKVEKLSVAGKEIYSTNYLVKSSYIFKCKYLIAKPSVLKHHKI